jgi:DNA-binding PucR family transcriptional regulator
VNTLRNRLARIEELTGRDLASTDDRVDLHLALAAEDLTVESYRRGVND